MFPSVAGHFGRKWVIVATMLTFTAFSVGVAAAKDIGTLTSCIYQYHTDRSIATVLICRFFGGLFAAAAQVLIPAQVSSLWAPKDLAVPFTTAAIGR